MKNPSPKASPDSVRDFESPKSGNRPMRREFGMVISWWVLIVTVLISLASRNLTVPGLYYDEAVFGGLAKDFLTGQIHGQHMQDHETVQLFGRPFPLYVQNYLGAVKSWLLLPSLQVFGFKISTLRLTSLATGLAGLLLFVTWIWRWLGLRIALLAGTFLALDPTFLFITLFDWGAIVPSWLCRFGVFGLVWLWWRRQQARYAWLAGVVAGIGFFNKVDFAVLLAAIGIAGCCCFAAPVWERLRAKPFNAAWAALGFSLTASPMLWHLGRILRHAAHAESTKGEEWSEKLQVLQRMYDGSHFYRLMAAGGRFNNLNSIRSPGWSGMGIIFGAAVVVLLWLAGKNGTEPRRRAAWFLVLAPLLTTVGALLVPGAVRIHHAVAVYPFPQLAIAAALVWCWQRVRARAWVDDAIRAGLVVVALALLLGQVRLIGMTQRILLESGGRGWWSDSLTDFAAQVKQRSDLTIVSLDWGFNEQLLFLTDGPTLSEPIWSMLRGGPVPPPRLPNCLFLVHAQEFSLFGIGVDYVNALRAAGAKVDVQPRLDREGKPVFYTIRVVAP